MTVKDKREDQACISLANLANRSRLPKCHHSSLYVGRIKSIWPRFGPVLLGLFMADIGPSFGLLVAQIWQTGADCPSAIIPCGMWVR